MEHAKPIGIHLALVGISVSLAACAYVTTGGASLPFGAAHAPLRAPLMAADAAKILLVGTGWVDPDGVAVDGKGDVYVSDYKLGEVREVSPPFTGRTHGKIRVVARDLDEPISVALDGKGNVYVGLNEGPPYATILQLTPSGVKNAVTTQIYGGNIAADPLEDVYAAVASLYSIRHKPGGGWKTPVKIPPSNISPVALAIDARRNLYATGSTNTKSPKHVVVKIEPSGKLIFVGSGWQVSSGGVAVPINCEVSCPVYVSEDNDVKEVTPPFTGPTHGKITIVGYGFSNPSGVAARGADVYVVDSGNVQVKEVIP